MYAIRSYDETDGYNAIQVGFANKKAQRVNKPDAGHFKKSDSEGFYHIREFRVADATQYTVGQEISVSEIFKVGDVVHVQGTSKGKSYNFV